MLPESLGIIGLGAIGGSVALDAARAGVRRTLGCSVSPADGAAALRAGAVSEVMPDIERVIRASEMVVIAIPPAATLSVLSEHARAFRERHTWITDTASVKQPIVRRAEELNLSDRFAGSHPFAGTHESGFGAARPGRFSGVTVYVTAVERDEGASREIAHFWQTVCGAEPVLIDAARHDAVLAWTSHLPQAVSTALAVTLSRGAPAGAAYASGAADTTRLAGSSIEMWQEVLLLNRHAVLEALTGFEDSIAELRTALADANAAAVRSWLAKGADWRRAIKS